MSDFVGLPMDKLLNRRNPITRIELLENRNGARPSATNIQISQISANTGNLIVDGSLQVINPTTGLPDVSIDQYGVTFANQEGAVSFEDTAGNPEILMMYSDADNFVVIKNSFGGKGISFLIDDASHVVNQVDITDGGVSIERGMEFYLESGAAPLSAGWFPRAETWTRTGDYTFTVSGDLTAEYRKGAKVRYKDGGSFEYGVIASSSESAGTTTVNLIGNTNYAMAAATITDNYISYIENPEGFPALFSYTPTYTGTGGGAPSSVTTTAATWKVIGANQMKVDADFTINNIGTATGTIQFSTPVVAASSPIGTGRENATTGNMLQAIWGSGAGNIFMLTYNNAAVLTNGYRILTSVTAAI